MNILRNDHLSSFNSNLVKWVEKLYELKNFHENIYN